MEELKNDYELNVEGNKENAEEKEPRFEVVKTLIKGKQSAKKNIDSKGNVKVTYHKKPIGYVVKDLTTGELRAVSHLEVVQLVYDYGATNVFVAQTLASDGKGGKIISPYIRSRIGEVTLQDPSMIVDPDVYLKEHGEIKVSEELSILMTRKVKKGGGGRNSAPKYSREALLKALKAKRAMLGLEGINQDEEKSAEDDTGDVEEEKEEEDWEVFSRQSFEG